jgi:predicted nucleic acid-binding protein
VSRPAEALGVVLDANVLYPQWLRDVLLTLAALGYYDPLWSQQIIDEMRRNVLGDHRDIDPQHFDDTTIAALRRAFPAAWVEVPGKLVAEMDNTPEDRHVLAAAVAAGAQMVVTANTAHFRSPRYVDSGQIEVLDPAAFLTDVLEEYQELMAAVLEHLASNRRRVSTVSDVLDELDRNEALRGFVQVARDRLL